MARHVDVGPEDGGRTVAYWRISSGRIVAVLLWSPLCGGNWHYRTDSGGGPIGVPVADIVLGNGDDVAISYLSAKVARSYASAKVIRGPVRFQVTR